jgi:hypothetical protein
MVRMLSRQELVVSVEGVGMDTPHTAEIKVSAMKPKLGDVISTDFEVMFAALSCKRTAPCANAHISAQVT